MPKLGLLVLLLFPISGFAQTTGAGTATVDWLTALDQEIMQLVTQKGNLFVQVGWEEFALFGGFALTFFLIKTAIGARRHLVFDVEGFTILLGRVTFVSLCLTYYWNPLPGTGISLHEIPIAISQSLSAIVTQGMLDPLTAKVAAVTSGLVKPSPVNLVDIAGYFITLGEMAVIRGILFCLNGNAYLFVGLLVLLGPLFIPLFLLTNFSRLFFKWVDLLVAYSMLSVTIAGFTYVWTFFFMKLLQNTIGNDYSSSTFLVMTGVLIAMIGSFLYMALKLPSFNAELFSGSGASSAAVAGGIEADIRNLMRRTVAKP